MPMVWIVEVVVAAVVFGPDDGERCTGAAALVHHFMIVSLLVELREIPLMTRPPMTNQFVEQHHFQFGQASSLLTAHALAALHLVEPRLRFGGSVRASIRA